VSQPRVTQILNLTLLAPEIQEELLHLPLVKTGKPGIHEKMVRPIAAEMDWDRQREIGKCGVRCNKSSSFVTYFWLNIHSQFQLQPRRNRPFTPVHIKPVATLTALECVLATVCWGLMPSTAV